MIFCSAKYTNQLNFHFNKMKLNILTDGNANICIIDEKINYINRDSKNDSQDSKNDSQDSNSDGICDINDESSEAYENKAPTLSELLCDTTNMEEEQKTDLVYIRQSKINHGKYIETIENYISAFSNQLLVIVMFMSLMVITPDIDDASYQWYQLYLTEILSKIFNNEFGYLNLLFMFVSIAVSFIYIIRENIERIFILYLKKENIRRFALKALQYRIFQKRNLFGDTMLCFITCIKYNKKYDEILNIIYNYNVDVCQDKHIMYCSDTELNYVREQWKTKKELNNDFILSIIFTVFLICGMTNIIYTLYFIGKVKFDTIILFLIPRVVALKTLLKITYLLLAYKKTYCTWYSTEKENIGDNILKADGEYDEVYEIGVN